jgi:hypothetical protein
MTYREAKDFLRGHTTVVELSDGHDARVLICPDYQGRVMTSTFGGEAGPSIGWIHREFIEQGKSDPHFNNYGGEDRLWLSPEGGPYSLWFAPGAKQDLTNWFTPAAMNKGAFDVAPGGDASVCKMRRPMKLTNTAGTEFSFDVERDVRLLGASDFGKLFGTTSGKIVAGGKLKMVGIETANTIINRGPALSTQSGLVSIWILGMLVAGPETIVIVPYHGADDGELGPVVKADYFGQVPPDRLKITPDAILFRGDSHLRSKIGVSQKRGKPVAGSIDFKAGVLTLVSFDLPENPEARLYMNNAWGVPQEHPYVGDVFNSYNDGPPAEGKPQLGAFYEIESLSPAAELAPGAKLVHHHRTFHIQADPTTLGELAKAALGVDLKTVRKTMLGDK